jgi:hypothetical protein
MGGWSHLLRCLTRLQDSVMVDKVRAYGWPVVSQTSIKTRIAVRSTLPSRPIELLEGTADFARPSRSLFVQQECPPDRSGKITGLSAVASCLLASVGTRPG